MKNSRPIWTAIVLVAFLSVPAAHTSEPGDLTLLERQAVLDMRIISIVLEEYRSNDGPYPDTKDRLVKLGTVSELFLPPSADRFETKDPWSSHYLYRSIDGDFIVVSPGPDRTLDQDYNGLDWSAEPGDDLITSQFEFLKKPLGQRERQKRTMADLRSIGTAIEEYSIDHDFYPDARDAQDLIEALAPFVSPVYIRTLPLVDGWGNPWLGWSMPLGYMLYSTGSDGMPDAVYGNPLQTEGMGKRSTYASDIVFENGSFVQWPEGPQH